MNDDKGSLINIDTSGFSEPAKLLVEKVSDAVGGIAKPWLTVRNAKAEVQAEVIKAEGRIQLSEIEERGLQRMVREEGKRQENIENITTKAIPNLSGEAKPDEVEDDWITHFFERCRLISDHEMQTLWSNILAGQANKPGTFSKKTVELVSTLDKSDAEMFSHLCSFVWMLGGPIPMIHDYQDEIVNRHGINFGTLNHLDDLGLINFAGALSYRKEQLPKQIIIVYYGHPLNIEFPNDEGNRLDFGKVMLTQAGEQLVPICSSRPVEEHYDQIISKWMDNGYLVSCAVTTKSFHKPF